MTWEWECEHGTWRARADLRGKNLEAVLAVLGEGYDDVLARQLADYELWLRDNGELADDEELLAAHLQWARESAQARRAAWARRGSARPPALMRRPGPGSGYDSGRRPCWCTSDAPKPSLVSTADDLPAILARSRRPQLRRPS
jgi:hypothetical protein